MFFSVSGYYCTSGAWIATTPTDDVTGDICPPGAYCVAGSNDTTLCTPGTYNSVQVFKTAYSERDLTLRALMVRYLHCFQALPAA